MVFAVLGCALCNDTSLKVFRAIQLARFPPCRAQLSLKRQGVAMALAENLPRYGKVPLLEHRGRSVSPSNSIVGCDVSEHREHALGYVLDRRGSRRHVHKRACVSDKDAVNSILMIRIGKRAGRCE